MALKIGSPQRRRNLGHHQLPHGNNKLPKLHFIVDLPEKMHKRGIDTTQNATTDRAPTTYPVQPPLLSGTHYSIKIASEPYFPHGCTVAIHLHRSETSLVRKIPILADKVAFWKRGTGTSIPRATSRV